MMSTRVCCREETAIVVPLTSTVILNEEKSMFPMALVIEGVQKTKMSTPAASTRVLTVVFQTPLQSPAMKARRTKTSRTARIASVIYVIME